MREFRDYIYEVRGCNDPIDGDTIKFELHEDAQRCFDAIPGATLVKVEVDEDPNTGCIAPTGNEIILAGSCPVCGEAEVVCAEPCEDECFTKEDLVADAFVPEEDTMPLAEEDDDMSDEEFGKAFLEAVRKIREGVSSEEDKSVVADLVKDEEEAISQYQDAATKVDDAEAQAAFDHIKGEEEEHIEELNGLLNEELGKILTEAEDEAAAEGEEDKTDSTTPATDANEKKDDAAAATDDKKDDQAETAGEDKAEETSEETSDEKKPGMLSKIAGKIIDKLANSQKVKDLIGKLTGVDVSEVTELLKDLDPQELVDAFRGQGSLVDKIKSISKEIVDSNDDIQGTAALTGNSDDDLVSQPTKNVAELKVGLVKKLATDIGADVKKVATALKSNGIAILAEDVNEGCDDRRGHDPVNRRERVETLEEAADVEMNPDGTVRGADPSHDAWLDSIINKY